MEPSKTIELTNEQFHYLNEDNEVLVAGVLITKPINMVESKRTELERSIAQKRTDDMSISELMGLYYDTQIGYLSGLSDKELMEERLSHE